VAFNAIAEHLDYGRRYTSRTNQIQRSFEDATLKQLALELVLAA
jgi:elongation factor P hydroxylase